MLGTIDSGIGKRRASVASPTFSRLLVIKNPASTNARGAARYLALLRAAFPDADCMVIETRPGGREANWEHLRTYAGLLGKRTLLCVAGGDGSVNLSLIHI